MHYVLITTNQLKASEFRSDLAHYRKKIEILDTSLPR